MRSFRLQAASTVQALLDSSDQSLPAHAWLHTLHCTLAFLDLRQHWPLLSVTKIQEKADSAPAQVPPLGTARPGACPYAHLRHTWSVMVEAASRLQTELALQMWLAKTETLAGLLIPQSLVLVKNQPALENTTGSPHSSVPGA